MTCVSENKKKMATFLILVGISLFALSDMVLDISAGVPANHLVHEGFLWLFSMIGAFYQFRIINWQSKKMDGMEQKNEELARINQVLRVEQKKFEEKISHLSDEFLKNIDEQFDKWGFSDGEREIALFLIKGLSMKEIANIRGSNENTVRQQASHIYKKSSLGGRLELSAFFLDDLLALSKLPKNRK